MNPQTDHPLPDRKSVEALRLAAEKPANLPMVEPGFTSLQSFELLHRQAKLLSSSTLVPAQYQQLVIKRNYKGEIVSETPNENAIPNCMIAMNMAQRMHADPLMVMQNLYIVEGRPSWSSQWIIAQINNCGRFSPLRFEIADLGEKTVDYTTYEWDDVARKKVPKVEKVKIHDYSFVAWALEKGTGEKLTGPKVTMEMAVKEGWYTKNGSKWQTMGEVMGRYRSAAFFGKLYAPELLMGIPTSEEVEDMAQQLAQGADGTYAPAPKPAEPERSNVADLRRRATDKNGEAVDAQVKGDKQPQAGNHEATPATGSTAATGEPEQKTGDEAGADQAATTQAAEEKTKPAAAPEVADGLFGNVD